MSWLWFAGPLFFLFYLFVVSVWPSDEERRLRATMDRWIDGFLGPLRDAKGKVKNRRVRKLPSAFAPLVEEAGGGTRVADVVLVPKHAYLVVRAADATTSTNQVTVVCRLMDEAPRFTCKPVPIVDGRPAENKGITFKKDPYFSEAFWVEGPEAKKITKWLRKAIRRRMLEVPEAWLRVRGDSLALTVYGATDEAALDALVDAADEIFAEYGADPDVSLFGELEERQEGYRKVTKVRPGKKASKKAKPEAAELAEPLTRLKAGAVDVVLYALAAYLIAMTSGALAWFHDAGFGSVFFNSPDLVPEEPWQGGWTTKGFGIFVASECLLVFLFAFQTFWMSSHGWTLGQRLFGARVERVDGSGPPGFLRGVLLRSWVFAVVPLGVAVATAAKPMTAAAFFAAIPTPAVLGAAAALVLLGAATLKMADGEGQSLRDRIAGTRVVRDAPLRLPAVQLGQEDGRDPVAVRRVTVFGGAVALFIVVNVVAAMAGVSFWIY